MTTGWRRTLYIGIALQGIWGVMELYGYFMEPVFAGRMARKFLQERSLAFEQFSGPEAVRRRPPFVNSFVWTRQEDQFLKLEAYPDGDLICLRYYDPPTSGIRRSICQFFDGDENPVIEESYPVKGAL
jgi:hypothetical protein